MVRRRTETYRDDWRTPPELFQWCSDRWGPFDVDLCASPDNALLPEYYTASNSALDHIPDWPKNIFANPPYGDLKLWVSAFRRCGSSVTAVLPANTSSAWFEDVWYADQIIFLIGRVSFLDSTNTPQPGNNSGTVLVHWGRRSGQPNVTFARWLSDIRDFKRNTMLAKHLEPMISQPSVSTSRL